MRFDGKSVLITGATRGIGAATARAFAELGANLLLTGRDEALGAEVLGSIADAAGEAALSFRPGEPIVVRSGADTSELVVEGPVSVTVQTRPGTEATLPPLRRVGLYGVRGAVAPMDRIAINLLSDQESDIRPMRSLRVNASDAQAGAVGDAAPLELWPILAAVAIGLLLVEWIVYCARIRGS